MDTFFPQHSSLLQWNCAKIRESAPLVLRLRTRQQPAGFLCPTCLVAEMTNFLLKPVTTCSSYVLPAVLWVHTQKSKSTPQPPLTVTLPLICAHFLCLHSTPPTLADLDLNSLSLSQESCLYQTCGFINLSLFGRCSQLT